MQYDHPLPAVLTLEDLTELLPYSEKTIRERLLKTGRLRGELLAGTWVVSREAFEEFRLSIGAVKESA